MGGVVPQHKAVVRPQRVTTHVLLDNLIALAGEADINTRWEGNARAVRGKGAIVQRSCSASRLSDSRGDVSTAATTCTPASLGVWQLLVHASATADGGKPRKKDRIPCYVHPTLDLAWVLRRSFQTLITSWPGSVTTFLRLTC